MLDLKSVQVFSNQVFVRFDIDSNVFQKHYFPELFPTQMAASTSTHWSGKWAPEEWHNDKGVWISGVLVQTRFHTVTTKDALHRYMACVVRVNNAFERHWNQYQNEQTPYWRKPERSLNPALSYDQLAAKLPWPSGVLDDKSLKNLHPHKPGLFEFWADPDQIKGFNIGSELLIRTNGGILIKLIQSTDMTHGPKGDDPLMNKVGKVMSTFEEADVLAHGVYIFLFLPVLS